MMGINLRVERSVSVTKHLAPTCSLHLIICCISLCLCVSSEAGGERFFAPQNDAGPCAQVKPLLALFASRGQSLPRAIREELVRSADAGDAKRVDRTLGALALLEIRINPESRVKVLRGPAKADLTTGR